MSALPILCYHNVASAPKEARFKLLYVSPESFEVGSHSVSHQRLQELPQHAALEEIAESRSALRNMLGVPIEHFAYPFGQFSAETVALVRRAGYASAVTVLRGVAQECDDRLRLPRILVNGERGLWHYLLHVATPYERLRRRRRPP